MQKTHLQTSELGTIGFIGLGHMGGAVARRSPSIRRRTPGSTSASCRRRGPALAVPRHRPVSGRKIDAAMFAVLRIPASCNAAQGRGCHPDEVRLRCLIVDDNARFLEAAAGLLEREGVTVVGVACNGAEGLTRARELRPDVILVDIALGAESGLELARRLVEADPDGAKVILISTHAEADFADLIDATPAAGFVAKSELSASAVRRVAGRPNEPRGT